MFPETSPSLKWCQIKDWGVCVRRPSICLEKRAYVVGVPWHNFGTVRSDNDN